MADKCLSVVSGNGEKAGGAGAGAGVQQGNGRGELGFVNPTGYGVVGTFDLSLLLLLRSHFLLASILTTSIPPLQTSHQSHQRTPNPLLIPTYGQSQFALSLNQANESCLLICIGAHRSIGVFLWDTNSAINQQVLVGGGGSGGGAGSGVMIEEASSLGNGSSSAQSVDVG